MHLSILLLLLWTALPSHSATRVFTGADFRIEDPSKPGTDWILVENGRVSLHGKGALPPIAQVAPKTDLGGKIVLPALTDAHAHLADLGAERAQINLRSAKSEAEAVARISEWLKAHPTGGTVYGNGWDQSNWPGGKFPSRNSLDLLNTTRPIVLYRVDGHAAWVNRAALEKSGIWHLAIAPKGGQIVRGTDNRPNGILIDAAMAPLEKLQESTSLDSLKGHYALAVEEALSHGITSVHEAGASALQIRAIRELLSEKKIQFRFYEMLSAKDPMELERMLAQGPSVGQFDGMFNARTVKLFLDGAMGSGGAAFDSPYQDDFQNSGLMQMTGLQLRALVTKIHMRGFQVAVHAIGSQANREAIQAFEGALGAMTRLARPRLEHAQVLTAHDIAHAARIGVIASMQPTHCTSDMKWVVPKIGPERARYAYAWKSWLDAKGILAFGSDAPVENINPWQGLFAAITRQTSALQPTNGFFPEERLTFHEAWNAFTTGAAHAGFQENDLGSLAIGRYADFMVVSQDPSKLAARALYDFKVDATYIAGNKVYERKQPTP